MKYRTPARRIRAKHKESYHLAILALGAVVIFLFASIALQFKARTTGYVTVEGEDDGSWILRSYATNVYNCESFNDDSDPYKAGYVSHSGNILSRDSCIDSSTLLEYSCDSSGRLKSDMIVCKFGCAREDVYGKCR